MILFIDCYDSFAYNLKRLIETTCLEPVMLCHNDKLTRAQLQSYLPSLHAIILGPGPGDPHNPRDSGIVSEVWPLVEELPVPVFGVCFGYQSMVLAFGGAVQKMSPPVHGQVASIEHTNSSMFRGIPSPFPAVRYHSLHSTVKAPLICTGQVDGIEMAVEHPDLPFFGVQFHPESVLSEYGQQIFKNFWEAAQKFNSARDIIPLDDISQGEHYQPLLLSSPQRTDPDIVIRRLASTNWLSIAEALTDFVLLKSASTPGEWSIFGLIDDSVHLRSRDSAVFYGRLGELTEVNQNIWELATNVMAKHMLSPEDVERINTMNLPFLGGLMGYITYEGCCRASLGDEATSGMNSDVSLVYVEKSIQVNEKTREVYAVGPREWVASVKEFSVDAPPQKQVRATKVTTVPKDVYNEQFARCYNKLLSGDSYELCLTNQASLEFPADVTPWDLFRQLVAKNPAPFSSFMAFDDKLVASSPERFLSWDRGKCEFRPIKGTVRKTPGMTLKRATEILRTPKEQGENLMIADLIRHDLGYLLNDVKTEQLMTVEEYHTVYQLVTSIEGVFDGHITGIDVLSQSLPPGSMTGAPKRRSVEILKSVEKMPRGLYSGVHGFWSIDDRGDWSVVIRSLFQRKNTSRNVWQLGAGGAITVLSTADGEFEEMHTKLDSVLNAFT